MRFINLITGINGVANNGVGTLNIPVNRRYHELKINCTQAGVASSPITTISNVQLIVNGQTMVNASPTALIGIANTFGITPATGELPLFFSEPWRFTPQASEATSWDMYGQQTFVLQLTFLNPAGAVGVTVSASFDTARNLDRQGQPFLKILKILTNSFNMPVGQSDILTFPLAYPLHRIFMNVSAGTITNVLFLADGTKVEEGTTGQILEFYNDYSINGTQFSFPWIIDYDQKLSSSLSAQNLDCQITSSAANTLTATIVQEVPGYR